MDRLIAGFSQGYTQALLDLRDLMPLLCEDMRSAHIPINEKRVGQILDEYIKHRRAIREHKGFVRWNRGRKELEFYEFEPTGGDATNACQEAREDA